MVFVISGPAGAGKGTVIKKVLRRNTPLHLAISWTTRSPNEGEVDGVDYYFRTAAEFREKCTLGGFAEWAEVHGNYYGTPTEELVKKEDVLLEIDFQGAKQIKQKLCADVHTIFLLPPSSTELERRLRARGREKDEGEIRRRLLTAHEEMRQASFFDCWLINDSVDQTVEKLVGLFAFLSLSRSNTPPSYRNESLLARVQATFAVAA